MMMTFVPKDTKKKETSVYKSLYIKEELSKKIEEIARVNNTSYNNVIISMIEFCLLEDEEKERKENH
jgi:hypothetical protein